MIRLDFVDGTISEPAGIISTFVGPWWNPVFSTFSFEISNLLIVIDHDHLTTIHAIQRQWWLWNVLLHIQPGDRPGHSPHLRRQRRAPSLHGRRGLLRRPEHLLHRCWGVRPGLEDSGILFLFNPSKFTCCVIITTSSFKSFIPSLMVRWASEFWPGESDWVRFILPALARMPPVLHGSRGVSITIPPLLYFCIPSSSLLCGSTSQYPSRYLMSEFSCLWFSLCLCQSVVCFFFGFYVALLTLFDLQASVLVQLFQTKRPLARPTLQCLHSTGGRHVQVKMGHNNVVMLNLKTMNILILILQHWLDKVSRRHGELQVEHQCSKCQGNYCCDCGNYYFLL